MTNSPPVFRPPTRSASVHRVIILLVIVVVTPPLSSRVMGSGTRAEQAAGTQPACPYPDGGACLGSVAAGRHTTTRFQPQMTYTVPVGWSNVEDLKGNVSLLAPVGTLAGAAAGTSDTIGVFTSAVPAEGCDFKSAPDVAATPSAFAAWLTRHAGLVTSKTHPVSIGGLSGTVVDMRMARQWTETCPFLTPPVVVFMKGRKPSSLEHVVVPGGAIRLYLLGFGEGVLAIEIGDASNGKHLDRYSKIVESFVFKS
jgi:hypothetical protein